MAQFCEICKQVTNCTDDCRKCLKEEETNKDFYEDLNLEQREQM